MSARVTPHDKKFSKKTTATIYHKKYYKAASNKFLSSSRQIKTSTHKSVFKKPIKQRNSPQINRSRNQGYNSRTVRQKIINMSAKIKDRNRSHNCKIW